MLFNSIEFILYLPIVFTVYWLLNKQLKAQNFFLLVSSYVFYGWWDYRFLGLIVFSSCVDYLLGLQLKKAEQKRKLWLGISLFVNLGLLAVFKYYNFFIESFVTAFASVDIVINPTTLNIILPVGISFYTFQTLSYTIDIYRKKLEPTEDVISFFAYVAFFPQLVAGPIERATNFLPQFSKKRTLSADEISDASRQILWGFFKKVAIADNCAVIVDAVFDNPEAFGSSTLILAAFLFAIQIYGDFSGYSDIAIGTAKLFGFRLMTNFSVPYFSRDISEFWRRWHISLTTWFRDYVYIPLGGSRGTKRKTIINTFIVFLVSGFWHGANWTFIFWGGLNALFFMPLLLMNKNRRYLNPIAENKWLPNMKEVFALLKTFVLITFTWIFFRSDSVQDSFQYLIQIFSGEGLLEVPKFKGRAFVIPAIFVMIIIEWLNRDKSHQLDIQRFPAIVRHTIYIIIIGLIFFIGKYQSEAFIYFQF